MYKGALIATFASVCLHVLVFKSLNSSPPLANDVTIKSTVIRLTQIHKGTVTPPAQFQQPEKQTASANSDGADKPTGIVESGPDDQQTKKPTGNNLLDLLNTNVTRYLVSAEVDSGARPVSDWVLRTEELSSSFQITINLTIYVNKEGNLDKFEIISSSIDETTTQSLLRELQSTIFVPAQKNGSAVANVRDVEITLESAVIPYGIRRFLKVFEPK